MINQDERRVIAVVTDAFAPFHREVLSALEPHISAAGFGTLAIAGRDIQQDHLSHESGGAVSAEVDAETGQSIHQLNVAGAVIVCGATPPDMSAVEIQDYATRLTAGPVVSLGIDLPGLASVVIGWDDPIAELMHHMTADPRRRRFGFIRGYPGDPHSVIREAGFRAGLAAAGLKADDTLFVNGNYSVSDSYTAVCDLLADGTNIDGLVAANDDMAIGALAALSASGLRVPNDVIVAGFDDSLAAFTSEPPLTSVRLDTRRLCRATANLVLHAIHSGELPPPDLCQEIDSALVVRASSKPEFVERSDQRDTQGDLAEHLRQRFLSRWEPERAPIGLDVDALARAAAETLLTGDDVLISVGTEPFREVLRTANPADLAWLRHAIWVMQGAGMELDVDEVPVAGLLAMARALSILDIELRAVEKNNSIRVRARQEQQDRLLIRLASCSDADTLWSVLRTGLRELGMTNAWVVASEFSDDAVAPQTLRLLFALDEAPSPVIERFLGSSVLPDRFGELLERETHVLVPLRAGAHDIGYLVVEPSDSYLLEIEAVASAVAQVLRHVKQVSDLKHQASALREANRALDHLARQDSLTGLPNRKAFHEALQREIDLVGLRDEEHLELFFLDLDGFKEINDTLGHEAGDHFLRVVADRLSALTYGTETVCRLGGDEFTVIVRHAAGSDRPGTLADQILEVVREPCEIRGRNVAVSASLGVARLGGEVTSAQELLRNADAAMYAAKTAGRGGVVRTDDELLLGMDRSTAWTE